MNTDFWMGFACGMFALFTLFVVIFAFAPKKLKGKKEPDYWVNKPVIHEEHLHPVAVTVTVDVPYEELTLPNEKYHKEVITSKLKLKMMDKIWEFVKVEQVNDPQWFMYRFRAKLLVLLPTRQALKAEVEKEKF